MNNECYIKSKYLIFFCKYVIVGRHLHQYFVANYIKIESHKLRWFCFNQVTTRFDLYRGLEDSLNASQHNAGIYYY